MVHGPLNVKLHMHLTPVRWVGKEFLWRGLRKEPKTFVKHLYLPQYTHNEQWVWSDSFFKFLGETRFVGIDCVLSIYVTTV